MFTEGLDRSALRWVREDVPFSSSNLRTRIDPITHIRSGSGGRGFGLPPPSKFRSGHLPSNAIPVRTIPADGDESGSASDNDRTTDSEDGIYGGRYSLDSSPQDDRVPSASAHRYGKPSQGQPHYGSDYTYSDVSSSMDTVVGRHKPAAEKLVRGTGKYPVARNGYTEDESSDSAASSEYSTSQAGGSINSGVPRNRAYVSEGYASSVPSQRNLESSAKKNFNSTNLQSEKLSDDDVPSAPPFCGATQEIKQDDDISPSRVHRTPHATASSEFKTTPARKQEGNIENGNLGQFVRTTTSSEAAVPSCPARLPTFYASALGSWHAVIAYDACVRLCLHAWAMECMEAPMFLENECAQLRDSFSLRQVLLQSEEELLSKQTSELAGEKAAPKPKKIVGKMKVQVRRMKPGLDPPTGCSISSLRPPVIKLESIRYRLSSFQSTLASGWQALRRIRVVPRVPANGSFSRQSLAYVHAGTQYIKQVSGLLKTGVTSLRESSSSYEVVHETYSCLLRLKSSTEEEAVRMQPGSGETHVFFPDSLGDDLIVEVLDSKGKHFGRVLVQVATIADDPADKQRWFNVYCEPEHELVGKIQLSVYYSTSSDDNPKCGSVAETVAYDLVLEVAMKVQNFQQRNLLLHGPWKWLLTEFASYYGVSDVYTKLRYLSYVMDVATPTADCLNLVYDLLKPVLMKGHHKSMLSHQENRILGETKVHIQQILALAFENYKSLDESSLSGILEVFRPATGHAAPALEPAVKLYTLLHDILSPEAQTALCHHFQVAAKKRSRRHLAETDEYVTNNSDGTLIDILSMTTAYQKMKSLCLNIRNEILTDIEIHNQHILPSFIDLPHLSSSIYSTELCSRLRAFLIAYPPTGPSPPVADLVIATADFQRDLASWHISYVKGGVDAKELFHLYIMLWIQNKRGSLLEACKLDKVKWSGVRTQHSTTPFVDEMYDRLKETLSDYEIIICRWPEYACILENAVADVEKAIVESLDKQYADILAPLKENLAPKKFGLKYVQKLAKRSVSSYTVPEELGILLNSLKRMLDVLRPQIEVQFKSWGSCIPDGGNTVAGERLSEVTVMLRAKFKNYLQAIVEKLAENTKLQSSTKMKKILQDSKETVVESDVRSRMQLLKDQLANTVNHLHTVFGTHVFIAICRGYWDRMGQDVLSFLENRKENRSWYKGSRIAVSILDDTFASQMQQLLGNALQEKDLEPPRSIMEVRSMLCKDAANHKDNTYYF
ncbi:PREDICTED: ZEAMMB73_Zm00001d018133 [Prunus dulcis]|uniref:PREDICTED: ZEAMMB73_Zm00001d018133 n=1 Tax=Prunus dulcis TaxID=3755 RepID=A0A5E4ELK8_PRUDU|nr:PREDICTED: ZEAMMB73_Zm00001d018133 [Prunus dulcis]